MITPQQVIQFLEASEPGSVFVDVYEQACCYYLVRDKTPLWAQVYNEKLGEGLVVQQTALRVLRSLLIDRRDE